MYHNSEIATIFTVWVNCPREAALLKPDWGGELKVERSVRLSGFESSVGREYQLYNIWSIIEKKIQKMLAFL